MNRLKLLNRIHEIKGEIRNLVQELEELLALLYGEERKYLEEEEWANQGSAKEQE